MYKNTRTGCHKITELCLYSLNTDHRHILQIMKLRGEKIQNFVKSIKIFRGIKFEDLQNLNFYTASYKKCPNE